MKRRRKNKGITLIALIVTVIVLLILASIVMNLVIGERGILSRGQEAGFKSDITAMAERVELFSGWQVTKTKKTDVSWVNAGDMLEDMVADEMIDLTADQISFDISEIIEGITDKQKEYIAVYKGVMHYVSSPEIKNNAQNIKWCQEIGIPVLYYEPPTGIVVVNGNYELVKGVYLCTPKLDDGFVKNKTRYLNYSNGNMVPGNWLTQRPTDDWYDYKNHIWANIYVENNGIETYYTWIPRYAYTLDQDKQESDVKFIDVKDNSYIEVKEDGTEVRHEWSELEEKGYQIPEAFTWVDANGNSVPISGYWFSKYTLGGLDKYTIDYEMVANIGSIDVKNITANTEASIAKYTYAVNGNIEKESETPIDYEFTNLIAGDNTVNVTALDANGEIIGSMTKVFSPAIVNEPDLSGFNKDTTFYVTWDKNGVEHSEIPISKEAPTSWYEYGASMWANIVTRNNGQETYYTWIPRYEYVLDQVSQKAYVKFIEGTLNQTSSPDYQIPEAFTWVNDKGEKVQIPGYWLSKYTLGGETSPRFDTEVTATSSSIKTKGITGSAVADGLKYMYYIDGEYRDTLQNTGAYEYTGLTAGKKYTINIIVRNSQTEEYIGSVTKQITTIEPNKPDLTGFNPDVTFYVTYDKEGNEVIGTNITNDGSNAPTDWYDYSKSIWANIVVKTENTTTYYTWIPRYEYKILSGQYLNTGNERTEVRFVKDTNGPSEAGYEIPEAFNWYDKDGNKVPIRGYWFSKYTLGEQKY